MNLDTLTASAAADLFNAGKLPANDDAAASAIARHVGDYIAGRAFFPLLSRARADALFMRDDAGLSGLGSALKKAVKKVANVVKDVAPLAVGVGAGVVSGNPQVGIAAMGVTAGLTGNKALTASDPGAAAAVPVTATPTTNVVPQVQPEPMVAGIPQRYLPWIALGFVALIALRR